MQWILFALIILMILDKATPKSQKRTSKKSKPKMQVVKPTYTETSYTQTNQTSYIGAYTRVPLLTKREQKQYAYLKQIADEKRVLICPKVRLLDLVTPVHGIENYSALRNKVMSKHVDFVICNQEMYVLGIIELDDSSHLRQDRIERDEFVDTVLRSAGYKIKHTWEITSDILDGFLGESPTTYTDVKIVSPTGWIWNENTKLWDPPENLK